MNADELGKVGLGTFPFSNVFSQVSQGAAEEVVHAFLQAGGRYIETAPSYPERGVSLRGILARIPRSSYLIGSKCVTAVSADGKRVRTGQYDAVREQCLSELGRLGVDHLDVLQAHITPEDVSPSETMQALESLKNEGLARIIGVSNVSLDQLRAFERGGQVQIVQNRLSLVHRLNYSAVEDYCISKGILLNPYQVIERGQLTTTSTPLQELATSDLRLTKAEYRGEAYDVIRNWYLSSIAPIALEVGCSLEALSIAWVLHQRQVGMCVVGATSADQARANTAAKDVDLSQTRLDQIDRAYRQLQREVKDRYSLSIEEFRGLAA